MNLELSLRRTKKWYGYGKYDGSVARIYLPRFYSIFINHWWMPPEWIPFGFTSNDIRAWNEFVGQMTEELNWAIVHELIHNIGIRHTKTWRSRDGP